MHPVVAGGTGKRLFDDGGDVLSLELVESRTFDNGVLFNSYKPAAAQPEPVPVTL